MMCLSLIQLAHEAMKYHEHQQELQRLRMMCVASTIAGLIRDFWTHMIEVSADSFIT